MGAIVAMRGRTTNGIRRPIGGVGQCANKFAPTALMVAPNYSVGPDIAVASTIDSAFYRDEATYALARDRIFARSWQWIGDLTDVADAGLRSRRASCCAACSTSRCCWRATARARCAAYPTSARIAATSWCSAACKADQIRCGYHSRRFDLSGRMTFMPEFAEAKNFPSASDDLPQIPFGVWAGHGFAALDPVAPLDAFIGDLSAAPRLASGRPFPFRSGAQPRLRGRRALGAVRRELPRGAAHPVRPSGLEPGCRLRNLRARTVPLFEPAARAGEGRRDRVRPAERIPPIAAAASPRTTGGYFRT